MNSNITVYGQLGVVDTLISQDSLSSGGYYQGSVARIGGAYTGFDNTTLYMDLEYGEANDYEDEDEDGVFSQIAIGGETSFNGGPWAITYEASFESYDALDDDNKVGISALSFGMRYYFGGNNAGSALDAGFIGTPDIMSRASLFTSAND